MATRVDVEVDSAVGDFQGFEDAVPPVEGGQQAVGPTSTTHIDNTPASRTRSPAQSITSDHAIQLDAAALLSKRARSRTRFTRKLTKVKRSIRNGEDSRVIEELVDQADSYYDKSIDYHKRYCEAAGLTDDEWLGNLRQDFQAARVEIEALLKGETAPGVTARTRAQLQRASIPDQLAAVPTIVPELTVPEVAPAPSSLDHQSLSENMERLSRRSGRARSSSSLSSMSTFNASMTSYASQNSSLSTLTRERRAAELELEMSRKRREEEQAENDRLAELARQLRKEKQRVEARRQERRIEEDIARLRMNETLFREPARSLSPLSSCSRSVVSGALAALLPKKAERKPNRDESKVDVDCWIEAMDKQPASAPALAPTPWMFGGGAPFACKKPFDGDPREWPLFISRFKALVHDVIPNDAQRLAILTEWVGPNVLRRITPLLKAPKGYSAALSHLKRHYGSSEQIARHQVADLLNLTAVKAGDHQALEVFADQLHGAVVVLQQGGHEHDLKSAANLDQAVQKLPPAIRYRWVRYVRKQLPVRVDLTHLDGFLEAIVDEERMARATTIQILPKNESRDSRRSSGKQLPVKSAVAVPVRPPPTVLATQTAAGPKNECIGCGDCHMLTSCGEFLKKSPSERALFAKTKGVCFSCLNGKHRSADCRSRPACEVSGCRARHNTLLHGAERVYPDSNGQSRRPPPSSLDSVPGPQTLAIAPRSPTDVLLAVVPVRLQAGHRTFDTFALLDSGSQATMLHEDAARALGLTGRQRKVRFGTFHGRDPVVDARIVDFVVASVDGDTAFPVSDAYVVPHLNVGQRRSRDAVLSLDYLCDLNFPTMDASEVKVLIGMDIQDAHLSSEVRRPPSGVRGPNALRTPFGWCVVGKAAQSAALCLPTVNFVRIATIEQLEESVERFWMTQSLPVRDAPATFLSPLDKAAIDQLEASIQHNGTRYEVGLPLKTNHPKLPDNREFACRLFYSLERRLLSNSELFKAVTDAVNDNLLNGHAVRVSSTPLQAPVWFLPYHPVRHPRKPEKIRLVYNAAARYNGVAINDILLKGPDLTTQLLAVMLRFRERRIGVTADISKMFYQVLVRESDRPMFRFLWRPPGSAEKLQEYEMTVHIFGAVSSPTVCTFALQRLIKDAPDHLKEVAQKILSSFYVDNFLASFDSEEEGARVSAQLTELLAYGGFNLVQFLSSSRLLLDQLPSPARLIPELDLDLDDLPTERTLGYLWNCERDEFVFRFKPFEEASTKRSILAAVTSIYDPIGLLAPVVLVAKIIIQDIWRLRGGWDESLPAEILNRWGKFVDQLPLLELNSVPRGLIVQTQPDYTSLQLHAFSDASKDGFGTVVYLRAESSSDIEVSFVMAKVRVAPIHQLSIPKMELQGALLSARLIDYLVKQMTLPITSVHFWVDAVTVLRWIHASHRRYVVFVANRIAEIMETTAPHQWRHVPGILNPADECSRGLCSSEMDSNHRWYRGPEFLSLSAEQWPASFVPTDASETEDDWIGLLTIADPNGPVDDVIARAGNLHRLIRIAAWIERFIFNARLLASRRRAHERVVVDGAIEHSHDQAIELTKSGRQQTADELKSARLLLIRVSQRASFSDELDRLKSKRPISRESRLLSLAVYLDATGIIRVGGRLKQAPISPESRHQAVLEPKHPFTRLIIRWTHMSVAHGRADRTLAEVRARYWVPRGREAAKSVISKCLYCSRMRARPLEPMMAPLPPQRVQPFNPPFTNAGVDYLGPFTVSIGRRTEKRWLALFTCLVTRAIHLEIVPSLDVDSFLMAFTRFVSRRGSPTEVFSDNGTCFTAGQRELGEAVARLNNTKIADQLARKEIRWHFSPPSAPHFGGAWERLVRSCKNALRAILGKQTVKDETFATVVIEVEALLNDRPLTYLGADPDEFEPLTPNHFILGRPNPHLPAEIVDPEVKCFRRRWFHAQALVDQVWKRWLREYLPTLTTRNKWTSQQKNLIQDDLVLMVDPKSPRGHWPLCRVKKVMPGEDGTVRTAEVITKSGKTFTRPVSSLCRLEALDAAVKST